MTHTQVIQIFKDEGLVSEVKSKDRQRLEIVSQFRGLQGKVEVARKDPPISLISKVLLLNKELITLAGFDKLYLWSTK